MLLTKHRFCSARSSPHKTSTTLRMTDRDIVCENDGETGRRGKGFPETSEVEFWGFRGCRPLQMLTFVSVIEVKFAIGVCNGRSKPLPYRVCASIVRPQKPFVTLTPSTTPWSPSLPEGGLDYTSPLSSETSHFLRRGRRPRRPVSTSFSQTASLSVILSVVEVL